MDAALEAHRRCLAAMREACVAIPEPHAHRLAALERELALAATNSLTGYLAASGRLFELTRAAWLDRAANQARVAIAVGDPWQARAAAAEHATALEATGHEDWGAHVAAGSARAAALRGRGADARGAFTRVLLGLLAYHSTADQAARDEFRMHATSARAALGEADPGFAGGLEEPRYANRVPWTGAGRATVAAWIAALVPAEPPPCADSAADARNADGPADADADAGQAVVAMEAAGAAWRDGVARREPSAAPATDAPATFATAVEDALAPYRAVAAAATGEDRVSAATRHAAEAVLAAGADAPTGPDAVARLVASGLLADLAAAPLRARAEDALERRSLWPDPLVEHHWRALLYALDGASTPTEVELVSAHAEACLAVEGDWNAALLGSLLAPLRAAGVEGAAGLERAAEAGATLFGLGPRAVAALPRVDDFLHEIVFPLATHDPGPLGAFEGEAGADVVTATRMWLQLTGAQPADAAALRDALLHDAPPDPPPPDPRPVALWGEPMALADLTRALARPARPPIPGLRGIAQRDSGL